MRLLSQKEINQKIDEVLKNGMWMLRRSNNGKSYKGFQWRPVGEWTEAPDWDPLPICGGGLHGNTKNCSGFWCDGKDLDFCAVENIVKIGSEKIKCQRAMVLLRNRLPKIDKWTGSLDLRGCDLKGITLPERYKIL